MTTCTRLLSRRFQNRTIRLVLHVKHRKVKLNSSQEFSSDLYAKFFLLICNFELFPVDFNYKLFILLEDSILF